MSTTPTRNALVRPLTSFTSKPATTIKPEWLLEDAKWDRIEGASKGVTSAEPLHLTGVPEGLCDHPEARLDLIEETLYISGVEE